MTAPPVSERKAYRANTVSARIAIYRHAILVTVDQSVWRGTEVVGTRSLYRVWGPPQELSEREAIETLIAGLQECLRPEIG